MEMPTLLQRYYKLSPIAKATEEYYKRNIHKPDLSDYLLTLGELFEKELEKIKKAYDALTHLCNECKDEECGAVTSCSTHEEIAREILLGGGYENV